MSMIELERQVPAKPKLRVIDCDIHPAMTAWNEVHPFLEKKWIEHLAVYGSHLRNAFSEALTHPGCRPMPRASTPIRRRAVPPVPASL